ncbi:unnamed protein product [Blepharisma stoltei]|uniref:RCC1-like domain-containing protein n=1 Tax=Blepharisma stoltei TaxID=1481888 RepID=A0AAU9J8S9_9CILI|nr:unnamed protein product [Blepharisma stoltei]
MTECYTQVFCWGSDTAGQLGPGDKNQGKTFSVPICSNFNSIILEISCGDEHTVFISNEYRVFCMGSNASGKLGISDRNLKQSNWPVLVEALMDYQIISIDCGSNHTAAISSNGFLFTWGEGKFGALGNGDTEDVWTPDKINLSFSAKNVSCGSRHSAAILQNSAGNLLFVWGSGDAGQLGNGKRELCKNPVQVDFEEKIKKVCCGVFHTLIIDENSNVYAMGGNSFGQLGIGNKNSSVIPVKIEKLTGKNIIDISAWTHSGAISSSGEIYLWGSGIFGEFLFPEKIQNRTDFVSIDIGNGHGAAIDRNGVVWTWGSNIGGALGTGNFEPKSQPFPVLEIQGVPIKEVSCGNGFTIALGRDISQGSLNQSKVIQNKEKSPQKSNKMLTKKIEELKKEISKLKNGPDGIDDLLYRLSQTEIRQEHLQQLYEDEHNKRIELEELLANSRLENEEILENLAEMRSQNERVTGEIISVEEQLNEKVIELAECLQSKQIVMNDLQNMQEKLKEIPVLWTKISNFENMLINLRREKSQIEEKYISQSTINNCIIEENKELKILIEKRRKDIENLNLQIINTTQELKEKQDFYENSKSESDKIVKYFTDKLIDIESEFKREKQLSEAKISQKSEEISNVNYQIKQLQFEALDFHHQILEQQQEIKRLLSVIEEAKIKEEQLQRALSEETRKNKAFIAAIEKELQSKAQNLRNPKFKDVFR